MWKFTRENKVKKIITVGLLAMVGCGGGTEPVIVDGSIAVS